MEQIGGALLWQPHVSSWLVLSPKGLFPAVKDNLVEWEASRQSSFLFGISLRAFLSLALTKK